MALIVLTMLIVFPGGARADSPAEVLYTQGQDAYVRADYATAVDKWQTAYDLSGESALLFNLAQAYRLAGDCRHAIETYRRFMIADPAAVTKPLAEDLVRELTGTCTKRAGPEVSAELPPPSLDNRLTVHREPAPDRTLRTLRIVGLATSGAGAISLTIGLVLGHRALTIGAEVTSACAVSCDWASQKSKDAAGRRDATIGYAIDAVGAVAIVGGAIIYYLGGRTIIVEPMSARGTHGGIVSWNGSW